MSLSVTLGCDITALRRGLASAVNAVSAASSQMRKIGSAGLAGIGNAGVAGLKASIGTAMKVSMGGMLAGGVGGAALLAKSIGKAAEMEGFETAFAPLLGGIKEAKERMADLAEFAKTTPFELPEVVEASRSLEVMTKGALATNDGMRLIGDAASVAQQPFQEVAMWVGRLYDGLQSGRPVGEATMRLQEMGLVSGETRNRIEEMQKSGASGPAVWDAARQALSRFTGGMEMQSKTWNGKMSNLYDAIGQVMVKLGTPIIDALKPYLDGVIAKVESLKSSVAAMGEKIKGALDILRAAWETGNMAELIGSGILLGIINGVNAFSSGIRKTTAYLGAALAEIMKSASASLEFGKMLDVFENIGRAIGRYVTGSIIEALSKIPGVGAAFYDGEASDNFKIARGYMNEAKDSVSKINGADLAQGVQDTLRRSDQKGNEAAANAGNANIIDPTTAGSSYQMHYDKLKARIDAQRSAEDIFGEILAKKDAKKLGKTGDTQTTAQAARLSPIVGSLARVGGGGYASGSLDIQKEANRLLTHSNATLIAIRDKIGGKFSTAATFA